jgi:hypothetical protein
VVSTAVIMKNGFFWDVKPCGCCKNRHFEGTLRLHHQGDKNLLTRNVAVTSYWRALHFVFLRSLRRLLVRLTFLVQRFLSPWWWRSKVPPKRRFLQEAHGVTSQKTAFFIVTAVKTSNLTKCGIIVSRNSTWGLPVTSRSNTCWCTYAQDDTDWGSENGLKFLQQLNLERQGIP